MTQQTTPATTGSVRPSQRHGQATEFTMIVPLKPGGAERTLERLKDRETETPIADIVGTIHDIRVCLLDNNTKLFFASTFDGDWDSYIDDFASVMPDRLDETFADAEDWPGMRSPEIKDYFLKYQVPAAYFFSAYPNATTKRIKRALRVLDAWEEMLDTAVE